MTSIREHVRNNPRTFCASGKDQCISPQYPEDEDAPGEGRCKSFRYSRCKSTVGWCRGAHHGDDHPANGWCDDCYVEVYLHPVDLAKKALHRFREVMSVHEGDDLKPTIKITVHRYGSQSWHIIDKKIMTTVREAGVTCPVSINGRTLNDEGEMEW